MQTRKLPKKQHDHSKKFVKSIYNYGSKFPKLSCYYILYTGKTFSVVMWLLQTGFKDQRTSFVVSLCSNNLCNYPLLQKEAFYYQLC